MAKISAMAASASAAAAASAALWCSKKKAHLAQAAT